MAAPCLIVCMRVAVCRHAPVPALKPPRSLGSGPCHLDCSKRLFARLQADWALGPDGERVDVPILPPHRGLRAASAGAAGPAPAAGGAPAAGAAGGAAGRGGTTPEGLLHLYDQLTSTAAQQVLHQPPDTSRDAAVTGIYGQPRQQQLGAAEAAAASQEGRDGDNSGAGGGAGHRRRTAEGSKEEGEGGNAGPTTNVVHVLNTQTEVQALDLQEQSDGSRAVVTSPPTSPNSRSRRSSSGLATRSAAAAEAPSPPPPQLVLVTERQVAAPSSQDFEAMPDGPADYADLAAGVEVRTVLGPPIIAAAGDTTGGGGGGGSAGGEAGDDLSALLAGRRVLARVEMLVSEFAFPVVDGGDESQRREGARTGGGGVAADGGGEADQRGGADRADEEAREALVMRHRYVLSLSLSASKQQAAPADGSGGGGRGGDSSRARSTAPIEPPQPPPAGNGTSRRLHRWRRWPEQQAAWEGRTRSTPLRGDYEAGGPGTSGPGKVAQWMKVIWNDGYGISVDGRRFACGLAGLAGCAAPHSTARPLVLALVLEPALSAAATVTGWSSPEAPGMSDPNAASSATDPSILAGTR
ncbi:hypothetical protein HYH02_004256 [Chlamydomonas schloesseri]|uniref:Uncharacterized protein n=1 Tax=Chlamydomonas schloesseri TaxID=2026947 RepID=A0A836B979_9CHLO|nr:hypothetical protein HYH02_004256 [Chlamydomonas schloesseri]|eukprot:KAG2450984.1 hypothetical protein HYH02_004256 [Chlamydomonas schloesseri]